MGRKGALEVLGSISQKARKVPQNPKARRERGSNLGKSKPQSESYTCIPV